MAFNEKIIEVQGLLDRVNATLDAQTSKVNALSEAIGKFAGKLPSDFINAQKEAIALSKAQQEEIKKLSLIEKEAEAVKQRQLQLQKQIEESAKNQTQSKQKLTKAELDYVNAVERGIKSKEKEVAANEKLNRAYVQVSNNLTIARNKLQDYTIEFGKNNQKTIQAQKEFNKLSKQIGEADKAVGKLSASSNSLRSLSSGIGNLMGAFGIASGLYLGASIVKNIYETTKQLQSLDLALRMVSGTQAEFGSNQVFLTSLAERYGIEIKGLTKNFTEFWVASKGKLEAEQIKAIFTSISKSVAIMGLSVEQQDSAFLALQQMMSKGTVQAEELKKQLGNALPGAVKAATMAYQALHPELQVTEKLFMEQMKAGKVLSAELLPELAKAYEKLYGIENVKRAETLQAAQERLANSWTQMVRNMNNSETGGLSRFFKFVLDNLTELADFVNFLNKDDRAISIVNENKARGEVTILKELNEIKKSGLETDAQLIETAKLKQDYAKKQVESYGWEARALESYGKEQSKIMADIRKSSPALYANKSDYKAAKYELEETNKKIKENASSYGFYKGIVSGTNTFLKEQNDILNKKGPDKLGKAKPEKQISIQDKILQKDFDYAIKMLEVAKKFQEEIFTDEERSYAERLAAREIYSKISLDLVDAQNNREIAIEKDKASQLLKNQEEARNKDLKANTENVKNGFADKRVEIENRYAENVKTINYNLVQDLYKIDLNYLEKTHDLQNQDLEFFKKIQKEKEKLTKETADIYFEMSQERKVKDYSDENRSLTQRQASFEAWKSMAEAQLFFDEALAKSESNQSPEQLAKITSEFAKLRKAIEDTESPLKKFADGVKSSLDEVISSFASNSGFGKTSEILSGDLFTNLNSALKEGLITQEEYYAAYFVAISDMAQEAFNFISNASAENFDAEYDRLERQKENALRFAGDSESGKAEIERQYERKRQQIARREAKAKKELAIFNIAIDTAQAIMGLWVKPGFPAAIPLAVAVGALAAIQIAAVSSQDIPQYFEGTDYIKGDQVAWTQEKGQEIIADSSGRIKDMGDNKGARLTFLKKGDKVLNNEDTMAQLNFNRNYDRVMSGNGILAPIVQVSNGITKDEYNSGVERLEKAISDKPSFQFIDDERGKRLYRDYKGQRTELINNRQDIKTYDV